MQCHDCQAAIEKGSRFVRYAVGSDTFYKCEVCHASEPILKNFRKTEVYSRVVGYIRPVEQWNNGKRAEYADRQEYCVAC
jgi:anaerobic ribonucleoside-triphosphate reductase